MTCEHISTVCLHRHCFAELNLLLQGWDLEDVPQRALLGYHSFTRSPKQQLLGRISIPQASTSAAVNASSTPALHMQLVTMLLDCVLTCCDQVSEACF